MNRAQQRDYALKSGYRKDFSRLNKKPRTRKRTSRRVNVRSHTRRMPRRRR